MPQELVDHEKRLRTWGLAGLLVSVPSSFQAVVLPGALPKWTGRVDPGPLVIHEVFDWLAVSREG